MKTPLVLHVILNSHLDPVWLWNRAQGEDAAIATAGSYVAYTAYKGIKKANVSFMP